MKQIKRAWTNDKYMSEKASKSFIAYMKKVYDQLIEIDNYLFDMNSLSKHIIMSRCLDCEKYQRSNCCKGNSYSMTEENANRLKGVSEDILKMVGDSKRLDSFYRYGAITSNNSTTTRGHEKGWCIFSFKDNDGCEKCAIHKWCIENGKNPTAYKPYPCSLFPIEGAVVPNGKIVIYCSCKETSNFSMFFYTLVRRPCVNEDNMTRAYSESRGSSKYLRTVNCDLIVKDDLKNDMNPAYIEQESVLRYFIGDDVYDKLIMSVNHRD